MTQPDPSPATTTATPAGAGTDTTTAADALTPAQQRKAGNAALKDLMKPVAARVTLGRVLGAASGLLAIAPYVALVRLGEALAATEPDPDRVHFLVQVLITAFLCQLGCLFAGLLVTHFADVTLREILRTRLEGRLARAPLSWFSSQTSGRVRKAVQDDVETLHQLIAHAPVEVAAAAITPLALVGYAFIVDWRLGILTMAVIPIYLVMQMLMTKDMGPKTAEMDTRLGTVSARAVEFVDGIQVVKAFGKVGRAHGRFATAAREFSEFYEAWCGPLIRGSAISQGLISVPVLALVNVGGGAWMVHQGWVSPFDVVATTLIALVVPGTIDTITRSMWSYQLAGGAALRISEALSIDVLPRADDAGARPADARVEFADVSFSYGEQVGVDKLSFVLEPGTVTALIGPSGSGKSTAATMLARFQDPDSGVIRLGGVDLRDLPEEVLYQHVSFVLQDPQLLRISLRDNIRLARPTASDEEVWDAARAAHIADDLRSIGLDAVYGQDCRLSGGQAQRIAIARAILADTPVVILDEATSSTDPDTEAEIQAALTSLAAGRTVLVIAHRPETIRGVDQLLILRDGTLHRRLSGAEITDATLDELMGTHHA
ncbi:ABC transporter ATP-binding protein [Corynebacterium uberis]|uniref:ABC transporter ATP-binding protein n=1 Tax=Corynebacterium TaxID=1716 RepID=UPI001D0BDC0A|nr:MULTISPECIES: ABC transporter ATP-binding protein [Corynebacterium]MCZ9308909.1 ABC transporter ATP-binding protein/permease [Corynebacterium sp. c6VSa_13]UDL74617.1 ABC transporter ATP-binding protein/permease [Corynebacterium uberis]UDL76549.1 ABC transporter ATP-binding protein/permease [Corynebacterium uberis]UDL78762.1 ABC transporter ATP-binding protein/permease [Corynebacterium uberis]UDL81040.1 ABC transporter ATP-binding protein/permease [Corynebacterium uberis]